MIRINKEKILELLIYVYYEELYPVKEGTADELNNRIEKAMDKYSGKDLKKGEFPILRAKVDNALSWFLNEDHKKELRDE